MSESTNNVVTNKAWNEMDVRLHAYVDFLETCFGVDHDGLADMIGCGRSRFKRNLSGDVRKVATDIVGGLAGLTGVSANFLCAVDLWKPNGEK